MRLFHITDLPSGLVFVYLEDIFREKFLKISKETFGNYRQLGEFVGYTNSGIIESFRTKNRFTRLSTIIRLADFFTKRGYRDFNLNEVEKRVIAYRGIGTSLIIKNPNFPLREDERMIRIFFHLLGDGYGGKYGRGGGKPYYRNYTKELLDEFKKDLKVFGEVPHIKRKTIVEIPKVIGYILEHIYKINFESHKSFIPSVIFQLPKEVIAQGIKAFADDEASVDDCRIRFYSSNKILLSGIKNLLIEKFPEFLGEIGKIEESKTYLRGKKFIRYSFPILSKGLKPYSELIGFTHPEKLELLERIMRRGKRKWTRRDKNITKLLILRSLKGKNETIKEISKEVGITKAVARSHFEDNESSGILSLKRMGFVKNIGLTETRAKIWGLSEKGLRFLKDKEHRLNQYLIEGNTSRFYLELVRKLQRNKGWTEPSTLAKELNYRNDTVSKKLLKLYRDNHLARDRLGKEEYRYRLTKEGKMFLTKN